MQVKRKERFGRFRGVQSGVGKRMYVSVCVSVTVKDDLWKEVKEVYLKLMWRKMDKGMKKKEVEGKSCIKNI